MKTLMVIFVCLFCLAVTPARADYNCMADSKGCADTIKFSPDNKATACQYCHCHATTANLSAPILTELELVMLHMPLIYAHSLKPSFILGPPLEPPTA